jgi:thiol:disulfide interchange protein DsbD
VKQLRLLPPPTRAVNEDDLLPVDRAYALSAKAVSRERIEFTWQIAPGYHRYRHQFPGEIGV